MVVQQKVQFLLLVTRCKINASHPKEEMMSNYTDIPIGKPFRILKPNKDQTVWQKNEHGLVIYFHSEDFWCNPPTDTNMETNANKAINKYGVEYLREDYVDDYNKNQRHKDLEAAMERHRHQMWKNRHLHPWMKDPNQPKVESENV